MGWEGAYRSIALWGVSLSRHKICIQVGGSGAGRTRGQPHPRLQWVPPAEQPPAADTLQLPLRFSFRARLRRGVSLLRREVPQGGFLTGEQHQPREAFSEEGRQWTKPNYMSLWASWSLTWVEQP